MMKVYRIRFMTSSMMVLLSVALARELTATCTITDGVGSGMPGVITYINDATTDADVCICNGTAILKIRLACIHAMQDILNSGEQKCVHITLVPQGSC